MIVEDYRHNLAWAAEPSAPPKSRVETLRNRMEQAALEQAFEEVLGLIDKASNLSELKERIYEKLCNFN